MNIRIKESLVTVTGMKVSIAIRSSLFKNWLDTLDSSLTVRLIVIQSVDVTLRAGKEHVLFIKLKADIVDGHDRRLPGIVFLRGRSVAILPVIYTECSQYAVLIQSSQPATGLVGYPQLPAGMMDGEKDSLAVAQRELREETRLDPKAGQWIDLTWNFYKETWKGVYPSPGACDESIELFLYRRFANETFVAKLRNSVAGLATEHEHIELRVVELKHLCRATPDMKALSALLMYRELIEQNIIA